jgi:hypothetical protein
MNATDALHIAHASLRVTFNCESHVLPAFAPCVLIHLGGES